MTDSVLLSPGGDWLSLALPRPPSPGGGGGGEVPAPGPLPPPTDLGSSLSAYLGQDGGQVIVIPRDKTLTGGNLSNYQHDEWLILLAEEPGTVAVSGLTRLLNCSRVLLGGINFGGSVHVAQSTSRTVLWYCDISASSGIAGYNLISYSGGAPGPYNWCVGTDIHDADHDGIKAEAQNFRFQGGRIWAINDPAGVNHDDAYQARIGTGHQILDFVFGLDKAGVATGNGHVQLQTDLGGALGVEMRRGWITGSGSWPINTDTKGNPYGLTLAVQDIAAWGNEFNSSLAVGSGSITNDGGNTLVAPGDLGGGPDVTWQAAHPYASAVAWLAEQEM